MVGQTFSIACILEAYEYIIKETDSEDMVHMKKRYERLDDIRGITLCSMILFHGVWDLVYIFDLNWRWFYADIAYIWQQSICWSFILLSGFCWSLGRRKLRRALLVFGAGMVITFVTIVFMPGQRIVYGILTFLGAAALLLIFLEQYLKKIKPFWGMLVCGGFFLLLHGINDGYLGIRNYLRLIKLPRCLYQMGDVGNFLGFTESSFYSTDYFSLLPWLFLYLTGYFLYRILQQKGMLEKLAEQKSWGGFFNWVGKHSLIIYMLHQPVVYGVLLLLDKFQMI